jgi:phospholipase/carboxylesterase
MRPVTVNDGMTMRAWYDILAMDVERKIDVAAVYQSSAQVEALIQREQERGIESQRILLAGFSQGGVVAYHTALRYPEPLAGVMALSTYLVMVASLKEELSPANRNIPLFVAHGTLDPVVPLALGRQAFDTLVDMGYQPNWHEYPMPHAVCPEEIEAISTWLKQVLTVTE